MLWHYGNTLHNDSMSGAIYSDKSSAWQTVGCHDFGNNETYRRSLAVLYNLQQHHLVWWKGVVQELGAPDALSCQPVQCIPYQMGPKKSDLHTNWKIFFSIVKKQKSAIFSAKSASEFEKLPFLCWNIAKRNLTKNIGSIYWWRIQHRILCGLLLPPV